MLFACDSGKRPSWVPSHGLNPATFCVAGRRANNLALPYRPTSPRGGGEILKEEV